MAGITHAALDYAIRKVKVGDNIIKMDLWDTAGQERFHSIALQFYQNASAAVVVYDPSDSNSLDVSELYAEILCLSVVLSLFEVTCHHSGVDLVSWQIPSANQWDVLSTFVSSDECNLLTRFLAQAMRKYLTTINASMPDDAFAVIVANKYDLKRSVAMHVSDSCSRIAFAIISHFLDGLFLMNMLKAEEAASCSCPLF